MVHGAEDSAGGVEDDVEENDLHGNFVPYDAEHHEDVRDHDGCEQFQEVLNPEVHDPEAPEFGHAEVHLGAGQHAHRVERGNREAGVEEQPRQVEAVL